LVWNPEDFYMDVHIERPRMVLAGAVRAGTGIARHQCSYERKPRCGEPNAGAWKPDLYLRSNLAKVGMSIDGWKGVMPPDP
jgi:hypothetical protein